MNTYEVIINGDPVGQTFDGDSPEVAWDKAAEWWEEEGGEKGVEITVTNIANDEDNYTDTP
jgi:hypothetical protein